MADEQAISPPPRPRQPKGERNEEAIRNALELKSMGFTILPVKTLSKDPTSQNWGMAVQNNPEVFLNNPGTRCYGVLPPPGCVTLDWDDQGEVVAQQVIERLGLGSTWPDTRSHYTPRGMHFTFKWPEDLPRPHGPWFGKLIARWPFGDSGQGYVVGPGCVVRYEDGTLGTYHVAHPGPITELPRAFAEAALAWEKQPRTNGAEGTITIAPGPRAPETVMKGERHETLLKAARYLFGIGLTGEALFEAVWQVNQKFPEPKTEAEVRRAIGDVERKFEPDPDPMEAIEEVIEAFATTRLIVPITDYRAANSAVPEWCSPLAAFGHVTLVSGPPKSGKSTLIGNLLRAREDGSVFLWGDPVPKGPTLLVTEEGGFPVIRKTVGLTELDVLDRMAFTVAGLRSLDHLLAALTTWRDPDAAKALVIIDTLAVWGDIKDENDAVAATRAITALRVWAQATGSALPLIHHTRKGGGDHGEAIRGSGGIFAAVDQSVELGFGLDPKADARTLTIVGRLDDGENRRLSYDRPSGTYSLDMAPPPDDFKLESFPVDDGKTTGLTRQDAEGLWDLRSSGANNRLRELVGKGLLIRRDVKGPTDRVPHGEYFRQPPLLNLDPRSASERLADIFAKGDED